MIHSRITKAKLLGQLLCLLLLVGLQVGGRAEGDFTLAPPNPDFLAAVAERQAGTRSAGGAERNYGYFPSPVDLSYLKDLQPAVRDASPLPARYDLRDMHRVTPVKDQGTAGTCWVFGSLASLESCLLPQEAWDFSENNVKNLCGFDGDVNMRGGNSYMVLATLARWTGPVAEADDPYNGTTTSSPINKPAQKHLQDAAFIPGRRGVKDNDGLKVAIMRYGAVAITMTYNDNYFNAQTNAYWYHGSGYTNHLIALVGWDDNYDKANFYDRDKPTTAMPLENGAFIARNSWGSSWGDGGYFYISYDDYSVGFSDSVAFYNAEPPDNYANIYQYDTFGLTDRAGNGSPQAWFANIFTAQRNESLAAVSWYNLFPDTPYTVSIYLDPVGDPTTGTIAYTMDGEMAEAGYHTVKLGSTIPLLQGHKFAVVVRIEPTSFYPPIPIECASAWTFTSKATANAGESYIGSDGVQWTDLTTKYKNANVCLKAFTCNPTPCVATPRFTPMPGTGPLQYYQVVSLLCDTPGATICYTMDGSEPKMTSTVYSSPITLLKTATLKAKAFKAGLQDSVTNTVTYVIPPAPKAEGVIVFTSTRDGHPQIYSMDAKDGSKQTRLTNGPANDDHACISPDSRFITFQSDRDGHMHIYRMAADGGNVTQLTSGDYDDKYPFYRRDGTCIVFTSTRDGHDEVYMMRSDGTQQTRITTTSLGTSSFGRYSGSVDDGRIVFQRQLSATGIFSVKEDGSDLQVLSSGSQDSVPSYDRDDLWILFNSTRNAGKQNIYRMDANGDNITALTTKTASNELGPCYDPNCDMIVFCSDRNAAPGSIAYDIYQMYSDGSHEKPLTSKQGSNTWPSWGPVRRAQPDRCTFSPAPGTYNGGVRVTITGDDAHFTGLSVYYTTDGSEPGMNNPASQLYMRPLLLTSTTTLKAKATVLKGKETVDQIPDSYTSSATYTVLPLVDMPLISPDDGTPYTDAVPVSISCLTVGATIRYTTNGNDPTAQSTAYHAPFKLTGSYMLRVRAFKTGMAPSRVAVMSYTVQLSAPTVSPDPGTYGNAVTVQLACAATGAAIHYTTDGSEPTAASPLYKSPFTFTAGTTLKAATFKVDAQTSPTVTARYDLIRVPTIGKIAFTSTRDGNAEIYSMNPDGSGQKRLTNNAAVDDMPCLSADGSKIAFATNRDGNYHIYVMGADGKNPKRLTTSADDTLPAFNLPATKICFTSSRSGHKEIYVMNADGSGQTRLTVTPDGESACGRFSPDGTKIVFASNRTGNWQIYTMDATGNNVMQLTNSSGYNGVPSFSPDGGSILFESTGLGSSHFYLMAPDGSNVRSATDGRMGSAGEACFSPDGSRIAYSAAPNGHQDLYAAAIAGSDTARLTFGTGDNTWPSWAGALALMPTFSPAPGRYSNPVSVSIKCATKGAVIYYTTDGAEPTTHSAKYTAPVAIAGTTTLKAKAVAADMTPSITAVGVYTFPAPPYVPDLLIRTAGETDFTGGGIYNQDGTNQRKAQDIPPGQSATYYLRVQNNGTAQDSVTVTAPAPGSGWTVTCTDAASGQPVAITGTSGWTTSALNAGQFVDVKVVVSTDTTVGGGASCALLCTAASTHDATRQDAVLAVTSVTAGYQPDVQLCPGYSSMYLGDNVYSSDGANQKFSQYITQGGRSLFNVRVENDGTGQDTMTVKASAASPGWIVHYYLDGTTTEVTADLTGTNGLGLPLAPGEGAVYNVVVLPDTQAVGAQTGNDQVILFSATSQNDPTKMDVVQAITKNSYQPDLWLKVNDGSFTGQNMYSPDGVMQSVTQPVSVGGSFLVTFRVVNNGSHADSFTVTAPAAPSAWNLSYTRLDTGASIDADITGATGWLTPSLAPGASIDFTLLVTPLAGATGDNTFTVSTASVADPRETDVAQVIASVQ